MGDFVHLHVHTEYSLLDGAIRIKALPARLHELNMDAIAITDHGVMFGAVEFYDALKAAGIKPIIGCEVYVAANGRFSKQSKSDAGGSHLVLLAENDVGYHNLCKICSMGFVEGFYFKPRVDEEVLKQYSEGIICLSACLGGEIQSRILNDNIDGAREYAVLLNDIFGQDNFFLELQDHGISGQRKVNAGLIELSKELGIPLVCTNDAHYMNSNEAEAHEILLCMQTGKTINDEDRMVFGSDQLYLKSGEEMRELFGYVPEAIENTVKIAERCNVEFDYKTKHLPEFPIETEETAEQMLERLCREGLARRYGENPGNEVSDRLEYELQVIKKMGFVDYFLITHDFINYAKKNDIMVGPGRGSAAGSIVAYTLEITDLDPMKYELIFERFLNPERVTMPDIDIDFCYERRQEVIDYVIGKYGHDRVAQIVTFGTLKTRAALKDTGRALAIPYQEVDRFVKLIPFDPKMTLDRAYSTVKEIRDICDNDERFAKLFEYAKLFEDMPRHSSTHAAGVVITKEPVVEYVPVQKQDESVTTQYTMVLLEKLGLLKMDFLGLRTLTVIRDTIAMAEQANGIEIDINNINIEDENVYKMISRGETSGIFQLESAGMTSFMKDLQPDCLEDIIAGVSLYRPGPMDSIPTYVKNKRDKSQVTYLHPKLEPILNVTYGCMVYQEQVMQIFRDLAGYSLGRSDMVRRAISKKKKEVLDEEKSKFVAGCLENGISEEISNEIYSQIIAFASYAFNKSHAACYALIAYQTAWLKYYYPVEFMAAMLNSFLTTPDKITQYITEIRQMGINLLPPDINQSQMKFSVSDGNIRFGLGAIKGVGESAVDCIINERSSGAFTSFLDFCKRIDGGDVNKRCLENIIRAGAFDELGYKRAALVASYEGIVDGLAGQRKREMEGQFSLFDMAGDNHSDLDNESDVIFDLNEYNNKMILSMEKELLGVYLSGHPLSEYQETMKGLVSHTSMQIANLLEEEKNAGLNPGDRYDGMSIIVAGIITSRKNRVTKSNDMMAMISIEDITGTVELMLFPRQYERLNKLFEVENIVVITGTLSVREDEVKVVVNQAELYDDYCKKNVKNQNSNRVSIDTLPKSPRVYVQFLSTEYEQKKDELMAAIDGYKGDVPLLICIKNVDTGKITAGLLPRDNWVVSGSECLEKLEELFGKENIKLV